MNFALVPCQQDGKPSKPGLVLPEALAANCEATADLYRRIGYTPPWIGYVATAGERAVGGGAFVGAPQDGWVEIAYFTLEPEQGQGYARLTATALVDIARTTAPHIGIRALTLMEDNASTKILRRLGFTVVGTTQDPDAGEVWDWRLPASGGGASQA